MGGHLSLKTFLRLDNRAPSDATELVLSHSKPTILALLMGVVLSLKTFIRLDYRATSDASESQLSLRKSTTSGAAHGGGPKPQNAHSSRLPGNI